MLTRKDKGALTIALILHFLLILGFYFSDLHSPEEEEEPFIFEVVQAPSPPAETTPQPPREETVPVVFEPSSVRNIEIPEMELENISIPESQRRERPPPPRPVERPSPPPPPEPPARTSIDEFRQNNPPPRNPAPQPRETRRPPVESPRLQVTTPSVTDENVQRPPRETSPRPFTAAERDELQRYFDRLHAAIFSEWMSRSPDFPAGLVAEIRFTISAEGRITGVSVVRSSGNSEFDRSVVQAMRAVRPVGRVPTGESLQPTLPFRME